MASTRKTPRTTKPARGQLAARATPISSGTLANLAASTAGDSIAASIARGSIHTIAASEASSSPLTPPRFQGASACSRPRGSSRGWSHQPASASSGICTSICRLIAASRA